MITGCFVSEGKGFVTGIVSHGADTCKLGSDTFCSLHS